MNLSVNPTQRNAKMRAHTATHLLHALLQHYIPTTQQAGSLVDDDYVRFDYTSDEMLTADQIHEINTQINSIITQGLSVTSAEMSYDDAIATGAKAFFQDKYGDRVRVVQVYPTGTSSASYGIEWTSIELCGGTHVSNTREIGAFVIVEQSPVASGTKRIVAYTGPKCIEYSTSLESTLGAIASKLDCTPKQIDERLTKILKDHEELGYKLESLTASLVQSVLTQSLPTNGKYHIIKISDHLQLSSIKLADIVNVIKAGGQSAIIIAGDGGYAIVGGSDAKAFAQGLGLRGGGSESLFQGKDPKILELL